jgi:hypothetical protein
MGYTGLHGSEALTAAIPPENGPKPYKVRFETLEPGSAIASVADRNGIS